MKNVCPRLQGECLLPPDMRVFVDGCPSAGSQYVCGSAVAFDMIFHTLHKMEFEDTITPITHIFEVVKEGIVGAQPSLRGCVDVGSLLVGLVFPVRDIAHNNDIEFGGDASVVYQDLVWSALSQGRVIPDAAKAPKNVDSTELVWTFRRPDIVLEACEEDITSLDFYNQFAPENLRATIASQMFEAQDGHIVPRTEI